jgi:hypothetical protein
MKLRLFPLEKPIRALNEAKLRALLLALAHKKNLRQRISLVTISVLHPTKHRTLRNSASSSELKE